MSEDNMFLELTANPGKYAGIAVAAFLEGEGRRRRKEKEEREKEAAMSRELPVLTALED